MDKTDQIVQQIDFSKLLNFAPQQVIGILNNLKTPILLEIFNKFPQLDKEYRVLYKKKIQNFLVPKDVLNEVQVETEQQLTGDVIREVKKTISLSHEGFEEHIRANKPGLLSKKMTKYMGYQNFVTYNNKAVVTFPLLVNWWRIHLSQKGLLDKKNNFQTDTSIKELFSEQIESLGSETEEKKYTFGQLMVFLKGHLNQDIKILLNPESKETIFNEVLKLDLR